MAAVYDPEELQNKESTPVSGSSPYPSSTSPGRINFTPNLPQGGKNPTSSSTTPNSGANLTPGVPESERSLYSPPSTSTIPTKFRFGNFKNKKVIIASVAATVTVAVIFAFISFFASSFKLLHLSSHINA